MAGARRVPTALEQEVGAGVLGPSKVLLAPGHAQAEKFRRNIGHPSKVGFVWVV